MAASYPTSKKVFSTLTDNVDVAPAMKFAVPWKNRWWGVDATVGNRLWFTQIFEPQSWTFRGTATVRCMGMAGCMAAGPGTV